MRDLHRTDEQREQSYSERQLYEAALERLTREVAAVSGGDLRVSRLVLLKRPVGDPAQTPGSDSEITLLRLTMERARLRRKFHTAVKCVDETLRNLVKNFTKEIFLTVSIVKALPTPVASQAARCFWRLSSTAALSHSAASGRADLA